MKELLYSAFTEKTGKINYYILKGKSFGVLIEQEKGICLSTEVRGLSESREKTEKFLENMAKNCVTAVSLYGLCDDFLSDTERENEQKSIKNT